MRPRTRHRRRRTTPCGESLVGIQVEIDPEDLALLETLGNGEASAGLRHVARTLEALPADVLARLEAEARAAEAAEDDATDS
jgi:hypothetical protein